jgi:glucoamylase
MEGRDRSAPGWPGMAGSWSSSAKSGVGCAISNQSAVWFTLSHGICNEIYYPRIDQACVRDLGLLVTDGGHFRSEERRDAHSEVSWLADGVPAYRMVSTCRQGRYRIEKLVLTDPCRPVLLQQISFQALSGTPDQYRLFVLLAPHLGNQGSGNNAWVGDYKGTGMLFAERCGYALALACSAPWRSRSVGYAGRSDGWQDLMQHGALSWEYTRAPGGHVALTGEVELPGQGSFLLALGFGSKAAEAGNRARAALQDGFEPARHAYVRRWSGWQKGLLALDGIQRHDRQNLYRVSTCVVRCHEAGNFPGGVIASLSIPWGASRGEQDLGGYHLVWPRDLVQAAGGLLAAGAHREARRVLCYLQATQEADGHWGQNLWLDGTPFWSGIQMDETALPVILVDHARRAGALAEGDAARFWPMVRRAAGYLVVNGPVSPEDRWEEDPGYSAFTVSAQVAALLAAAEMAELNGEPGTARYLEECADIWNGSVERWMYVTDSAWCGEYQVPGYYCRVAQRDRALADDATPEQVVVANRAPGEGEFPAAHLVSPDVLALVRFGLRTPDDPRILATLKLVDTLLKIETPGGPVWHRYNGDGYGEHDDGSPFDGVGRGRVWPLLTGERAHYELARGCPDEARRLKGTLESLASSEGFLPEQSWDRGDLPERELYFGRPTGSAMPLVWAHAEYLKLLRSLSDGRVFDLPPQTVARYRDGANRPQRLSWRFNHRLRRIPAGFVLRIETRVPALVYWSCDAWESVHDTVTRDGGLGIHLADLDTGALAEGRRVIFTFYWPDAGTWEGTDFSVAVEAAQAGGQPH